MTDALVTTVAELVRVPVFSARRRPVARDGCEWQESPHGRVRVAGVLGQGEADVFEACMYAAFAVEQDADGRLYLEVPVYTARTCISPTTGSGQGFERGLDRLVGAVVELDLPHLGLPSGETIKGKLFDRWEDGGGERYPFGGKHPRAGRRIALVWIGDLWMEVYRRSDLPRYDSPRLFHGLGGESAAIARYLMTQSRRRQPNGGWRLDTLLAVVGVDVMHRSTLYEARRRIRKDKVPLKSIGIILDKDDRVFLSESS